MVEELDLAIDAIIRGGGFLSPSITQNLDVSLAFDNYSYQSLTNRELEIFKLLAAGSSVNDIAEALFISIYTVYTHFKRYQAKSRHRENPGPDPLCDGNSTDIGGLKIDTKR